MTGREIVNLIDILQAKNMSSDEIIEIIRYVEMTDPKARDIENNFKHDSGDK